MALQTSGQISLANIATEFGGSVPHSLSEYYGVAAGIPSSGAITISDFYGASSQFAFTITSNQTNANLATLATNAGWDGASALVVTINSGVYISSNSTGTPALTVSGSFPAGVTLTNNGYIVGRGGNGGYGTGYNPNSYSGIAGASGGLALSVSSTITIQNNGTIAGGGGGGGGGGGMQANEGSGEDTFSFASGGGGGGGGRSSAASNSSGGAGGNVIVTGQSGGAGSAGTVSSAGAGGSRGYYDSRNYGGNGGAGGNWGASGAYGGNAYSVGYSFTLGKAGGAAGGAVSGNSNVTWSATGTRLGGIS